MPILVGIDGTGEMSNASYEASFAKSFVRRLCKAKVNAQYFRGPIAPGGLLPEAIAGGLAFIYIKRRQFHDEPILLTGYSRGALGVVVIAKRLQDQGIKVRAMMLFDCVDRHTGFDAETIPNNVEHVLHVIRHPGARSRMTFGNDAMKSTAPTEYPTPKKYLCTHGGMGGVPWKCPPGKKMSDLIDEGTAEALFSPTRREPVWTYRTNVSYAQDAAISQQVWRDVQPFLLKHHFIASPLNLLTRPKGQPVTPTWPRDPWSPNLA